MVEISALNGSAILITGATGLIGSELVETLLTATDCEVYATCRQKDTAQQRFQHILPHPRLHLLTYDVTQPLETDIRFDYIIHAASPASPASFSQYPVEVMMANILGVRHLLDYGQRHQMKRMLFISSGEIYGEGDGTPFQEHDSGYIDSLSPRACYPSDVVIARLCHTYGPGFTEKDNRVYAQFLRNVLRGEDIVMKSAGRQMRSWIYVQDAVDAILTLLLKGEKGEAYNVADAQSCITIRSLAEKIAALADRQVIIDIPQDATQGNTTPISCATFATKKIEALGWKPRYTIDEGLRQTLQRLQNQG